MLPSFGFFEKMGIFGFQSLEPLILASLVTEDPILLLGKSGTGKTLLLNRIAESLGLNHKHYNASLISFDDLIGFPFPTEDKRSIEFLPTPATLWDAESILLDEISRCKPEIQNKFFSIIQEKKLQGMALERLRFRWAAMNPSGELGEEDMEEYYEGSEPLDPALADRFSFLIPVLDWKDFTWEEQERLLTFDHRPLPLDHSLQEFISQAKEVLEASLAYPLPQTVEYCRHVSNLLMQAGVRLSPRRIKILLRNITAVMAIYQTISLEMEEPRLHALYLWVLQHSMPHRAWASKFPYPSLEAAHQDALRMIKEKRPEQLWFMEFFSAFSLERKLEFLADSSVHRDIKSAGFLQWMLRDQPQRVAAFLFATFPLLEESDWLNQEAMEEVRSGVNKILVTKGTGNWKDIHGHRINSFEDTPLYQVAIATLPQGDRKERATQLFCHLQCTGCNLSRPVELEREFHQLFQRAASWARNLVQS
jgi:MoxR-like ATPase